MISVLFKRFLRRKDGVAAIEFAFVLPVFLLFVMGILEVSYMLFGNAMLDNAVSKMARSSSLGERFEGDGTRVYESTEINQYIRSSTVGIIDPCSANFSMVVSVNGVVGNTLGQPQDRVSFVVTYRWPLIQPYLSNLGIFDNIINYTTSSMVRNEKFNGNPVRTISSSCS